RRLDRDDHVCRRREPAVPEGDLRSQRLGSQRTALEFQERKRVARTAPARRTQPAQSRQGPTARDRKLRQRGCQWESHADLVRITRCNNPRHAGCRAQSRHWAERKVVKLEQARWYARRASAMSPREVVLRAGEQARRRSWRRRQVQTEPHA